MHVEIMGLHYIYLVFILLIIAFMVRRLDTSLLCVVGILCLGLTATSSLTDAVRGIFDSFVYAIKELLGTILVISMIVSLSNAMTQTGIHEKMVAPFARLIRNPTLAYWVTGLLMMIISCFFWPSPAVALLGAVLLPVAIRAGLPAIGVAIALNLFGHGIALSGDFIIQGAPKLTADAAGIPVSEVVEASIPLVIIMGAVTTLTAFWMLRRDLKKNPVIGTSSGSSMLYSHELYRIEGGKKAIEGSASRRELRSILSPIPGNIRRPGKLLSEKAQAGLAAFVPLLFLLDVAAMFVFDLQGGDATALIGGTALLLMAVIAMLAHRSKGLDKTTELLIEGFHFGFKVFGPVIPIAAFFYLGDSAFTQIFGDTLPAGSAGIVNDLGSALANQMPLNKELGAVTLTGVGAITGLDGSGFSGISLAGSIAHLFAQSIGSGIATLTALGQIAAIWVGGGTLIPWALIPAAAICGVDPFELARRNLIPVACGLIVTTIAAMLII